MSFSVYHLHRCHPTQPFGHQGPMEGGFSTDRGGMVSHRVYILQTGLHFFARTGCRHQRGRWQGKLQVTGISLLTVLLYLPLMHPCGPSLPHWTLNTSLILLMHPQVSSPSDVTCLTHPQVHSLIFTTSCASSPTLCTHTSLELPGPTQHLSPCPFTLPNPRSVSVEIPIIL